jgi:uncharacterized protein (TIGR00269 family)
LGAKGSYPDTPVCSLCDEPAVTYQRLTCRHLCGFHFIIDIEQRVADTIRTRMMIVPQDRIAVALSGGKDSTALLIILNRLFFQSDEIRFIAITIDEGITGYREETIRSADHLTKQLGIEHHCLSFYDLFGYSLDDLLNERKTQACSICGILRKKALVTGAQRVGATKIATGHNLDDEAQSVLMNAFRGDLLRLVRNSGSDSSGKFIPRVKPLSCISEKDIALYLILNNAWTPLPECPYTGYALRREVRAMLSGFEYRHPGTMLKALESKKKIEQSCAGRNLSLPLGFCKACGDPCSGDLCQVCLLLQSLKR